MIFSFWVLMWYHIRQGSEYEMAATKKKTTTKKNVKKNTPNKKNPDKLQSASSKVGSSRKKTSTTKRNQKTTPKSSASAKKNAPTKKKSTTLSPKIEEPIIDKEENISNTQSEPTDNKKSSIQEESKRQKSQTKTKKVIKYILIFILFCIFAFTTYRLTKNRFDLVKNRHDNDKLIEEVLTPNVDDDEVVKDEEKPAGKRGSTIDPSAYKIDIPKLKKINSDTVGWIIFNSYYVNNPVVKTVDNEYYLTHSFYRGTNEAGAIFMDYRNSSFADRNVVIYGHATIDRSMFGSLSDVFTAGYFDRTGSDMIYIYDAAGNLLKYRIFSYYTTASEEYYITTHFKSDAAFQEFINTVKSRSFSNRNIAVTSSDKILTLSTCYGSSGTDMRRVIHAKRV